MITIKNASGISLITDPDQRLTLEQAVGWLSDDSLPGGKSYPIPFPIAPNEAFLGSGYRPDAAKPVMEFPVTVTAQNILYRRCVFAYQVSDGKGSGYLKIDAGEVWSKLRKLSLKDAFPNAVLLGNSLTKSVSTRMEEIARMAPGEFPFTFFPVRNELFFEETLDDAKLPGFVRQPYVNAWTTQGFKTDSETEKGYPVVPFFFLPWVLQQLFLRAGYELSGDWLADPATQRLVIFNQCAIDGRPTTPLYPYIKLVSVAQHLPDMSVGDFLKAVRQRFGLIYTFNSTTQVATIRRFSDILKSRPVDLTRFIAGKYGIQAGSNQGFSVIDFVDANDQLYKVPKKQVVTPGSISVVGEGALETVTPVPLRIGGGLESEPQEVKQLIGSTQEIYEPSFAGTSAKWLIPTVALPGNMLDPAYKNSDRYTNEDYSLKNQIAPRIISYFGFQPDSLGNAYPQGSPNTRNGRQETVTTQSTQLAGRSGIWANVLRSLYYFRDQTRQITVPLNLPVAVAASLQLHEPVALALSGHARRTYLIEKIQSESPGPSGIMESKLYAYSLPDGIDLADETDAPLVWVEWIVSPETYTGSVGGNSKITRSYTVKFWQDAARTQVALVTALPVNVRRKHKLFYDISTDIERVIYSESVISYSCNGQSQVIESNYVVQQVELVERPDLNPNGFAVTLDIDPGDGYTILRA